MDLRRSSQTNRPIAPGNEGTSSFCARSERTLRRSDRENSTACGLFVVGRFRRFVRNVRRTQSSHDEHR